MTHNPSPKVVVIGAGLAGLTTAYRLHKMGFDVAVYEARNRVGGRVFTIKIDGHVAELGAQNIRDGGAADHFFKLAEELNLPIETQNVHLNLKYFDGSAVIDPKALVEAYNFDPETLKEQLSILRQSAKNMHEVLYDLFKDNELLYNLFSVRLAGYEGVSIEHLSTEYTETLYHMLLGGLAPAHTPINDDRATIESAMITGGNGLIAETVAQRLAGKIHLNSCLQSIEKREDSYLLGFQTGEQVAADILVMTIPCPVYKKIVIEKEIIPQKRLKKITSVLYGTNAKIIIPLDSSEEASCSYTNGRMVSFFHPSFHALNLYYVGDHSKFTAETVDKTFQEELPMLKQCYPIVSDLSNPVIARNESFASYCGPVAYSWPNDPYAGGSYSCIAAGQEKTLTACTISGGEKVRSLFAPIGKSLFFAGEHTSILFDAGGTMEAAVESGERTARIIKNLYDLPETVGQDLR